MSRPDRERLQDILDAAEEVAEIVAHGRSVFDSSSVTRRALERLLQIVGEAARTLPDDTLMGIPSVPWSAVIGFRHLVTHHYFRVDDAIVWDSAANNLPPVASAIRMYLNADR